MTSQPIIDDSAVHSVNQLKSGQTIEDAHQIAEHARRLSLELMWTSVSLEGANHAAMNLVEDAVQTKEALRQRERWLAGQREALEAAVNGAPLESSLGVLVRTAIEAMGEGARAGFYLANDEGTALHHVVGMPEEYAEAVDGFKVGPDSLACGLATATGRTVLTADVRNEPLWQPWLWMAEKFDYRGCWSFPIHTTVRRFVGTLAIYSRRPREATKSDLELASLVTHTASIIISRHKESEERRRAEQALRECQERLAADLADMQRLHALSLRLTQHSDDLESVMDEVLAAAAELLRADKGSAQVRDPQSAGLSLVSAIGFDQPFRERFATVQADGFTTCAAALRRGERVIVEDTQADSAYAAFAQAAAPYGLRAAMSTPLLGAGGELLGVFTLYWPSPHRPSERELRLLDLYVQQVERNHAQQALRKSQAQLATEVADLETLRQLSLRVAATSDRTAALTDVLETAIGMVAAAKGNVQLYDAADDALTIIAHRGFNQEFLDYFKSIPVGYSCCGTAMERRDRVIIEDVYADPRFCDLADIYARHGFVAVQSTPLFTSEGRLLGMFSTHFARPHCPSERDLRLLDQIAQQAGRVIERTSAEQAQRESEARFRMLADNMAQLAWTCDKLGNCTWYNRRWLEYTGLAFEDMKGWDWSKVHHPDHLERVVARVKRSAETGEFWEDTFPLRGADGRYRWFLSRAYPIRDEQGNIIRWFGTNTDIDDQIRAEEALREADRRKDEFLGMLAHELRNPLAAISSAIQVVQHKGNDAETVRWATEIVDRQIKHMVRQVDDLLDVSRIGRGKIELRKERIELTTIVNHAVQAVGPLCQSRRHALTVKRASDPMFVDGDAVRLTQVVSNLLNNACKFTDDGGHICLTLGQEGQQAVIRVRDTGIGIAAGDLCRIFEVFAQADRPQERSNEGLGLGLALVKNLVEMHDGAVEAHSAGLGQGSEFIVRLPLT
jgi:PAS domain S-box-containing protein